MKPGHLLGRLAFHTAFLFIRTAGLFSHQLYMRLYLPLLKAAGMRFDGKPRYIGARVEFDDFRLIALGDRTVISDRCRLVTHDYSYTTARIAAGKPLRTDTALIRGITLGNNVFVGTGSLLLPGTEIGNDVVIGAGSVVRGRIPDGSVVAGNPAAVLRSIHEQAVKWDTLPASRLRSDKR